MAPVLTRARLSAPEFQKHLGDVVKCIVVSAFVRGESLNPIICVCEVAVDQPRHWNRLIMRSGCSFAPV